ncbi:MAG: putative repeat protein (TIGR01451 family), partial [Rhodothermales bacterium]
MAQPTFSQAFSPTSIVSGNTSVLTYTINNSASGTAVSAMGFTNTLPANVVIATPGNLSTTCSLNSGRETGTLTGADGGTVITLAGASVASNSICTITVTVTSSTASAYVNTSGALSTSAGSAGTSNATLTVAAGVLFSKAFSPATIVPGGVSTLTFTINNASGASKSLIQFGDTFPDGMFVATNPNTSTTCTNGHVGGTSGATGITFSAGTLASAATCLVTVDVTVPVVGTYTNTTTDLIATFVAQGTATADLTVALTDFLSQSFGQQALPGESATLTFTINNNAGGDATGITFTNDLNATLSGLAATALPATGFCGTGSTISGTSNLTVSGGNITSGGTCSFEVTVLVPASASAGAKTNTTSTISATISGGSGGRVGAGATVFPAVSASLTIVKGVQLTRLFIDDPVFAGNDVTARYTLTNTDAVNAQSSISFQDPVTDGVLAGTVIKTLPNANSCGAGSTFSSVTALDVTSVAVAGGVLVAGGSCTFDVILTTAPGLQAGTYARATTSVAGTASGNVITVAGATDNLVVAALPALTKAFSPTAAAPGDTVTLTYTFTQPQDGSTAVTALAFTDNLATALSGMASTSGTLTDICGTGSSLSGTTLLTLAGGNLASDASCTFSVTAQVPAGATPGVVTSTTSSVTGTVAGTSGSGPATSATLSISGVTLTSSFLTNPVFPGAAVTNRYTITNAATAPAATAIQFEHKLHEVISTFQATSLPATPCGAGSALAGTTTLTLSGGVLDPGASCTFDVPMSVPAGAAVGAYNFVTTDVSATVNGSNTSPPAATAVLTVESPNDLLTLTKSFTDDPVGAGGTVTLQFSVLNASTSTAFTNVAFTDDLNAALTGMVATGLPQSNVCGTGSTLSGTGTVTLAGGQVAANSSCTFSVSVSVPGGAAASTYTNTTGQITGNLGGAAATGNTATDAVVVVPAGAAPGFSKSFGTNPVAAGQTSTLVFSINNTANSADGTGLMFSDAFPTGLVVASTPNVSSTCLGGTITAAAGSGAVSYAGGTVRRGQTCTVSVGVTAPLLGNYLNTSGALTSSLGASSTSTATLGVVSVLPVFSKSFSADPAIAGAAITLTFTVNNVGSVVAASGLAFTDTLPSGLMIAEDPNGRGTCSSGTLVAGAGTGAISYSGGVVGAGSTCTITVDVTAGAAGDYTNTSGPLNSSLGLSGTATATLRVNALPVFTKSFSPNPALAGSVTSLTFTIDNGGSTSSATALAFTDSLPVGLVIADSPNGGGTCTLGNLTAVAGTGVINYSGGTAGAGSSCTITVDVTAASAGDYANTSGVLNSSLGVSGAATAALRINGLPGFAKTFSPNPALAGSVTSLTFTIDNTGSTTSATALAFSDALPAGLVIAASPNGGGTCASGTLTAVAGTSAISYSGGTAGASTTCTVTVDVTAASAGDYTNTSGALSSALGLSGTATATLRVNALPVFAKAFSPNPAVAGSVSTLTFTVDNTGSTTAATALTFVDTLPAGLVIGDSPNAGGTCQSGTLIAEAGTSGLSYSGGTVGVSSACTITVDVTAASAGDYANTSGPLSSSLGLSGTATATLRVDALPGFTKSFSPNPAVAGSVTTLAFTINNTGSTTSATALSFT